MMCEQRSHLIKNHATIAGNDERFNVRRANLGERPIRRGRAINRIARHTRRGRPRKQAHWRVWRRVSEAHEREQRQCNLCECFQLIGASLYCRLGVSKVTKALYRTPLEIRCLAALALGQSPA